MKTYHEFWYNFSLLFAALSCAVLIYQIRHLYVFGKNYSHAMITKLETKADEVAQFIDIQLKSSITPIEELVKSYEQGLISETALTQKLAEITQVKPLILNTGIAYDYYKYKPDQDLHSVFIHKNADGSLSYNNLEQFYNYAETPWFKEAKLHAPIWLDPFIPPTLEEIVIRYAIPFYKKSHEEKNFMGIIFADINREQLNDQLFAIDLKDLDYSVIVSSHDYLITSFADRSQKVVDTIEDIKKIPGKNILSQITNSIKQKKMDVQLLKDAVTLDKYWVVFQHLKTGNWVVILAFKFESLLFKNEVRRQIINICLLFILFVTLIAVIFSGFFGYREYYWWIISLLISFLVGIVIWLQLFLVFNYTLFVPQLKESTTFNIVPNKAILKQFMYFNDRLNQQNKKPPIKYIPFGLLLNAIDITENNRLIMSGFLWEKHGELKPDIAFMNMEKLKLREIYKSGKGDEQTTGWFFNGIFTNEFNYTTYPFDYQQLILKLFYPDLSANVVLIPDFDAFRKIDIQFGLEGMPDVTGWQIDTSFFYFTPTHHGSNYGIPHFVRQESFPDLNFVLMVSRRLIGPLITYILPLIIIAIILFCILIQISLPSSDEESISSVISQLAGMLFATALIHQTLKRALASVAGLSYIEYFYFVMYAFIMLITANGILYLSGSRINFIRYRRNLLAKILFWPSLFVTSLIITLGFFY